MFSKEFINGTIEINELYTLQNEVWRQKNIELFGITSCASDSPFVIRKSLLNDQNNYWNNGTCKLKERLLDSVIRNKQRMIKDTWLLEFNPINNLIGLSATFIYTAKKNGKGLSKASIDELVSKLNELPKNELDKIVESGEFESCTFETSISRVAYLPFVNEFGYRLKNSEYALRTQAARNPYILRKINGVVKQNNWEYKDGKFKDGKNHFCDVKEHNYPLLNAILGEQVTEENFTKALDLMPEYESSSVMYFSFHWFDEVENSVLHTSRKFINTENGRVINYASLINSRRKYSTREMQDLCSNLIIVKNKLKALEVSRSVLFAPVNEHARSFSFRNTEHVFDAFKVTTNALAGRIRVLLDNIYVEDGILKCTYNGVTYNQYDLAIGKNLPDELKNQSNLSSISCSMYNYLNDAKRIMFCAKLRSQAVRVTGQLDDLTHEVPARVVFADWEGYSFGDSFVISESFAKKLERNVHKYFMLDKKTLSNFKAEQKLEVEDLVAIDQKNRFSSWRDIYVNKISNEDMEVVARAPFGVGDKISNLHGSKGIVSIILPDDQMPILTNDLSSKMPAGPVDIIIPGISVYRRKSTGQIFEALARAIGFETMTLQKLKDEYFDVISEYDSKSVFTFQGKTFKAPCGINHFIRLDHDATSKQSFAYIKNNYKYNLHVAEMELLALAARGEYAILNELDIRSMNKHTNALRKIRDMQKTGRCPEEEANTQYLKDYFRYLGYDFNANQPLTKEEVSSYWQSLFEILDNKEIDVFDESVEE